MAAVFTAADITGVGGLAELVGVLIVAFVGVNLIYTAYRHSRKAGIR